MHQAHAHRTLGCLLAAGLGLLAGCGSDEMHLVNRTELKVSLNVLAPRIDLRGGCSESFRRRFCDQEYSTVGVVDVSPGDDRLLTLFDTVSDDRCTNLLWLRVLRLDEVGPVDDRGTVFQLPVTAEIEREPGRYHSVAFPQATLRIDEVGEADDHQGGPPPTCAELGRAPR